MGFEKVEELLHGKMEIPTMVSGEVVCRMDLEKINGEMGPIIKDTTKTTKKMELATIHGKMAVLTEENGRITRCKVMAAIDGLMEGST